MALDRIALLDHPRNLPLRVVATLAVVGIDLLRNDSVTSPCDSGPQNAIFSVDEETSDHGGGGIAISHELSFAETWSCIPQPLEKLL